MDDNRSVLECGEVWVNNDKITYVGEAKTGASFAGFRQINCQGDCLIPGLINTHTHLPMTVLRGIGDEHDFDGWWVEHVRPIEVQFTEDDCYWSSLMGMAEMLEGGTTSVISMYFKEQGTLEAFKKSGMRGAVAVKINNLLELKDAEREFNERLAEIGKCPDTVQLFVQSHSINTTEEPWLNLCTKMAKKYELRQTIHLSETLGEVGKCDKQHGKTPVEYLEQIGFFDYPTLIAHGVHVDKDDMAILRDRGVGVSINMSSNLKLGSGIAPVASYLQNGVSLSLGTDSASSNNALDLFREMLLASIVTKGVLNDASVVKAKEAFYMATRGGAEALGLADKIGQLKVGFKADIVRISSNGLNWQPNNNKLSNIVYSANKRDVVTTMVNGKILYDDGKFFIGENLETIKLRSNRIIKRICGDKKHL